MRFSVCKNVDKLSPKAYLIIGVIRNVSSYKDV